MASMQHVVFICYARCTCMNCGHIEPVNVVTWGQHKQNNCRKIKRRIQTHKWNWTGHYFRSKFRYTFSEMQTQTMSARHDYPVIHSWKARENRLRSNRIARGDGGDGVGPPTVSQPHEILDHVYSGCWFFSSLLPAPFMFIRWRARVFAWDTEYRIANSRMCVCVCTQCWLHVCWKSKTK